jgi:hypothetical protein
VVDSPKHVDVIAVNHSLACDIHSAVESASLSWVSSVPPSECD